ncbi:MAG: hypothetical protein N2039_06305, partial [Gemmataceae bacterium]|nr:hypothetical protein [Gemmataceae bacterium]
MQIQHRDLWYGDVGEFTAFVEQPGFKKVGLRHDGAGRMNLEEFERLLTDQGQSALRLAAQLRPEANGELYAIEALRRKYDADLARMAISMTMLRQAARKKFAHAETMYFTRDALEQASGDVVAEYRAERFRSFGEIGDFCCGIGGDTMSLARVATV